MELYISEDKDLFHALFDKKGAIEADAGLTFDWRELPDRKASRIVIEKAVSFSDSQEIYRVTGLRRHAILSVMGSSFPFSSSQRDPSPILTSSATRRNHPSEVTHYIGHFSL